MNDLHFNSELEMIPLVASGKNTRRECGHFEFKPNRLTKTAVLKIVIHNLESPRGGWKHTLLHEMVHYFLYVKHCTQAMNEYMNNPSPFTMRKARQSARKANHTMEFNMLLDRFDRVEKLDNTPTPEKKKVPVKRPTAPKTGSAIGDMIETFCGQGKIVSVTATYYIVKLAKSGNEARVRI